MATNLFTVEEDNVSVAWIKAVELLVACGGECFNLMVSIKNPTQTEPTIHTAYEQLLSIHGLLTLKQVKYTIFPRSLYIQVHKDPDRLFERYNRVGGVYDRLRRRYSRKFGWGSYFRRMTCYPVADVVADVVRIRTDPTLTNKDYIVYALNTDLCADQFRSQKTGTTRPRVNVSNVRNILIPLPPLSEQREITYMLSSVDKKILSEENRKAAFQALFKTMLHQLMTGKVRAKELEATAA